MALSKELISQVVKTMNSKSKSHSELDNIVCGKTVVKDGTTYVQLDGSELLTPAVATSDTVDGERVTVQIKNHTATITGNISSPAARVTEVNDISAKVMDIEIVNAYKVSTEELDAVNADIDNLKAGVVDADILSVIDADIENLRVKFADLDNVSADNIRSINADIDNLVAKVASIENLDVNTMNAITANIETLKGHTANFKYVIADIITATKAQIEEINATKLSVETADAKYINIDFANIDKAQMSEFYAKSGLIEDITVSDSTITGRLVGVTISGDLIEGNTIKANRLVVLGDDGLYYKLNFENGTFVDGEEVPTDSLHGSVITANSITAEKISVSDLVAFDATIGGFEISNSAIHSFGKDAVDNNTTGIYLDSEGQLAVGDGNNYIKYYKTTVDEEEVYKLEISADSVLFDSGRKNVGAELSALTERVKIGTYTEPSTGNVEPSIELSEGDSNFKQIITNTKSMFVNKQGDSDVVGTTVDIEGITTTNVRAKEEFRIGSFVWSVRENGNCGILWKG